MIRGQEFCHLQIIHKSVDNVTGSNTVSNLNSGVHQLTIVPPIQSHPVVPEVFEEMRENVILNKQKPKLFILETEFNVGI